MTLSLQQQALLGAVVLIITILLLGVPLPFSDPIHLDPAGFSSSPVMAAPQRTASSEGILPELERIIPANLLHRDGVPVASVALLTGGNITSRVITSGHENADTIFQGCSISKTMTALAVARLVDLGRITYETKVKDRLSKTVVDCLTEPTTAKLLDHVTVGMILSHTAGLSVPGFDGYAAHSTELPTAEDVICGKYPFNSPRVGFISFPGAQWSYSGGGYTVLQLFLEDLQQQPFAELMQDLVLQPLGMKRSFLGSLTEKEANYAPAYSTAYTPAEAPGYHLFPKLAAAGLWTTPSDLLLAISAVQASLFSEKGFLTQQTARKMLTHANQAAGRMNYAHGWFSDSFTFGHYGVSDPGYRCFYFGIHGEAVNAEASHGHDGDSVDGFAVMTNPAFGYKAAERIISALYYLVKEPMKDSFPSNFGAKDLVPYAIPGNSSLIPYDWEHWIGTWAGQWEIVLQGDLLALRFEQSEPIALRDAAAPTKFLGDGKYECILVAEGLKTAVRLTWRGEARDVEILQSG